MTTRPDATQIPVIDFAPFPQGDRHQVAQEIYHACHDVGFLYLRNAGLSPHIIQQAFTTSQQLFSLPLAAKQQVAWTHTGSNRGYIGLDKESLNPSQPRDLKEAFNLGKERSPAELAAQPNDPSVQPNRWPEALPSFRPTMMDIYDHFAATVYDILRAFALALDLPEDYFCDRHQSPWFTLRLLHYPPLQQTAQPGQLRAGAHSDYGTLTLLVQDDVGGLEVQRTGGEWIAAPAIPDTVIINTGDLMERWSNGVFRSTRHRVALPKGAKAQGDRYSMAFFCEPDPTVEIRCLPTCTRHQPPQYPPITTQDYLMQRLQATY
ncbi:MAG: 2-oxoglutarate and iron-dependent oxygenase domain-containing protein [Cyanobacteria bacterium P01_A01_bin.135]